MKGLTEKQIQKVEELLSRMTLEEKIGQMNQAATSLVGGFDVPVEELIEMMTDGRISREEFEKIMSTAEQDFHEDEIRSGGKVCGNVEIARKCPVIKLIGAQELFIGTEIRIRNDVVLHQLQFDVSGHCRLERPQRLLALPCQPPHAVQINRLHVCPFFIIYCLNNNH